MDSRTRKYLQGRFRDHYRRTNLELPPEADNREWGIVPWTKGMDERFDRHKSLLDMGDIDEYMANQGPKHVYFSGAKYESPAARNMDSKKWLGADLVFDIDAKDLPSVEVEEMTYRERLEEAHEAVERLVELLEDQFGFENMTIVFSGGQGFHIHVRDEHVQSLDGQSRGDIVNFVKGNGYTVDRLLEQFSDASDLPLSERVASFTGGWNKIVYKEVIGEWERLSELGIDEAKSELQSYDGIGEVYAGELARQTRTLEPRVVLGAFETSDGLRQFVRVVAEQTVEKYNIAIDEPVSTDVNRLIRFPGTLHGGTGFQVTRIPRDELSSFDPFQDAVADTFASFDIKVEVTEGGSYSVGDVQRELEEGEQSVPEKLGVYLMAQRKAEKLAE